MTVTLPSIEEMAMMAHNARASHPVWTSRELKTLHATRDALRSIPMSSSLDAIFEALGRCIPIACGLLDMVRTSRPFDPIDVLYRVPEAFLSAVTEHIEDDPSPLVLMRVPLVCVYNATSFVSVPLWQKLPITQALYPHHGIDFPRILTLSSTPRGYDRELTTLWLFHEHGSRPFSDRELSMLEVLHGDILAAIERLRLPFLPRDALRYQLLSEQNSGYALLRINGELIECNSRALSLAQRYTKSNVGNDRRTLLSTIVRGSLAGKAPAGYSVKYIPSADRTTILEIAVHFIAKEHHAMSEDATLVVLKEIPIQLTSINEGKQALLESLAPRRRQVATLLVNSGLSYKEMAHELRLSESTLRKHAEYVYRALRVRSRAELTVLLK